MRSLILLQIVMVTPETHLGKNRESQSRTNESQLMSEIENARAFMKPDSY